MAFPPQGTSGYAGMLRIFAFVDGCYLTSNLKKMFDDSYVNHKMLASRLEATACISGFRSLLIRLYYYDAIPYNKPASNRQKDLHGIFAVAMTLLVLNISVPQISSRSADIVGTELLKRLFDLWPKILSYAISFLILAIYWSGHHRQFHYIKHSDRVLVWINIMFLMSIALLPFSTSLLGEYGEQQISIFVYGGNSIIIAGLLYIQWRYATSHHRLVDENLDPFIKRTLSRRVFFGIIIYLIAMGVSFVFVQLGVFLFTLILISAVWPSKLIDRRKTNLR